MGIAPPQPVAAHNPQWQRLSPIAILYFATSTIRGMMGNVVYLIPVIIIGYSKVIDNPQLWIPLIVALFSLLCLFAVLSFRVYRYRLTTNNIEIRSGIFKTRHLNLPFSRIQSVKIEQPVYYRLAGFACLQLDTAGSVAQEAKVVALPLAFAGQLKQQILNQSKSPGSQFEGAEIIGPQQPAEQILNQRSLADLVLHGISSNRIWIFLGALAPFFDNIANQSQRWSASIGLDFKDLLSLQSHSFWQVGLYALSLAMLVMLVLVSFSVIGSVISFYGYTLSKLDDRYIRRSGLFTKHEVSMRISRLQMIVRQQDWLDRVLNRINLKFEQSNDSLSRQDPSDQSSKIIVPSINAQQCKQLISDAYPDNQLENIEFVPISKHFILRYIGYYLLPAWLIGCAFALQYNNASLIVYLSLALVCLSGLVVLRWHRWAFAHDQDYVYLRKGLIGVDYYCFPTYKIQQTQFTQSLLMKRRQLANVKLILASSSVAVPLIAEDAAYQLLNKCLYKVESSHQSWM